jgi:hypothetical protein
MIPCSEKCLLANAETRLASWVFSRSNWYENVRNETQRGEACPSLRRLHEHESQLVCKLALLPTGISHGTFNGREHEERQ